jgi:hypothetical protein
MENCYGPAVASGSACIAHRMTPIVDISTRRPFRSGASWLALFSCASLACGLALPGPRALAAEAGSPTIDSAWETNATEHSATLNVQISPHGGEATYEIWLECEGAHPPAISCEPLTVGEQRRAGEISAGFEARIVSAEMTGLQLGYDYVAVLLATGPGGTAQHRYVLQTIPPGASPTGGPERYETYPEPWVAESAREWGEGAPAREAARQQAAKEQAEREAASARANQPGATATGSQPAAATGSVSLGGTTLTVSGGGVARVKLECRGSASCRGKLTLSAKIASKGEGKGMLARTVRIGTTSFTIPGDEAKTVRVKMDAAGRALLGAGHGRVSAHLTIRELAPGPRNTQATTVHLVEQRAAWARKR